MAFSSTITEVRGMGPSEGGYRQYIEGTWEADGDTAGEIDLTTYLERIDECMVWADTQSVTLWGPNKHSDMSTAHDGILSIGVCNAAGVGGFWAKGPIAQ